MCYIGDILGRLHGVKKCAKCGWARKHHKNKRVKDGLCARCVVCCEEYGKPYRERKRLWQALLRFLQMGWDGYSEGDRRTRDIVGCSACELVDYLNDTMSRETCEAFRAGEKLEIVHNVPQSLPGIDITNDTHVRAVYHFTNLQFLDKTTNSVKRDQVPDGFDTAAWLEDQSSRIEECKGMTPSETRRWNRKMLAEAREFANTFRRITTCNE